MEILNRIDFYLNCYNIIVEHCIEIVSFQNGIFHVDLVLLSAIVYIFCSVFDDCSTKDIEIIRFLHYLMSSYYFVFLKLNHTNVSFSKMNLLFSSFVFDMCLVLLLLLVLL